MSKIYITIKKGISYSFLNKHYTALSPKTVSSFKINILMLRWRNWLLICFTKMKHFAETCKKEDLEHCSVFFHCYGVCCICYMYVLYRHVFFYRFYALHILYFLQGKIANDSLLSMALSCLNKGLN